MIRKLLVLGLSIGALSACESKTTADGSDSSGGACAESAVVGTWKGDIGDIEDTIQFKADCTGTSTACEMIFEYPAVTGDTGIVKVDVSATNGESYCLPVGETACEYEVAGDLMGFNCGNSTLIYEKQ
ncbi:MAG: hypothetical protein E6Q97_20820 [Desulfurellales bacterium]|nr:MAG: hypothetical protein E6Q97_20820 [Desulfurellales bacterium]